MERNKFLDCFHDAPLSRVEVEVLMERYSGQRVFIALGGIGDVPSGTAQMVLNADTQESLLGQLGKVKNIHGIVSRDERLEMYK